MAGEQPALAVRRREPWEPAGAAASAVPRQSDLRTATVDAIDAVMGVYLASFMPMVRGYHPNVADSVFDGATLREMWKQLLRNPDTTVVLAHLSDGSESPCVGVLAVKPSAHPATLELAKLFIRPEHQSLGIGRKLTEECLLIAATQGYEHVDLWTWEIGHQGRRFYEAYGFRLTDDRGRSGYPGIEADADVTLR